MCSPTPWRQCRWCGPELETGRKRETVDAQVSTAVYGALKTLKLSDVVRLAKEESRCHARSCVSVMCVSFARGVKACTWRVGPKHHRKRCKGTIECRSAVPHVGRETQRERERAGERAV